MDKNCFVVSPIGNEGSTIRKHADTVFGYLIDPVCTDNGYKAIRADHITRTSTITDDIFECLDSHELAIVDISNSNPNVFLELGWRMAKGLPYILIRDKNYNEHYPFDVSGIRILEYSTEVGDIETSKQLLSSYIKAVESNLNEPQVIHESSAIDKLVWPNGRISIVPRRK